LRRWFSGDGDRLGCPNHPDARLLLSCECGADLPAEAAFQSRKPLALGFAGPRSSGKTLMTIAMVEELRGLAVEDRRIALNPLDDTEQSFHRLSSQLLREGAKPAATDLEEASVGSDASRNFCWKIYVDGASGRRPDEEAFLAVYDVAGETWGLPAPERLARFDRYAGLLGSVVFLIDGAAVAADLGIAARDAWDPAPMEAGEGGWTDRQWLARLQSRLGPRAQQVDLALVLSKADYFWNLPEWQALRPGSPPAEMDAALQDLLLQARRIDLWTVARKHFRRAGLFAVSSLGFHPGPQDVDTEGRLRRKIEPAGMAAPLSWLLKQRLTGLR
jgi:hypothetical protein